MKLRPLAAWRPLLFLAAVPGASLTAALPASAHHSFAMFDSQHPIQLEGTVRSREFINSHGWLVLMVMSGDTPIEYNLEGSRVSTLIRQGFGPHTFAPGDKITAIISPLKSGEDQAAIRLVAPHVAQNAVTPSCLAKIVPGYT